MTSSQISYKLTGGLFKYDTGTQKNVTVDKLSLKEVMELFSKGNLTQKEVESWLEGHKNEIENQYCSETNNTITYTFKFKNQYYTMSCTKDAAKSQTDRLTAETYSTEELKNNYKLTESEISEYFDVATSDGVNTEYRLKSDCKYETAASLALNLHCDEIDKSIVDKTEQKELDEQMSKDINSFLEELEQKENRIDTFKNSANIIDTILNSYETLDSKYGMLMNQLKNAGVLNNEKVDELKEKYEEFVSKIKDIAADKIAEPNTSHSEKTKLNKLVTEMQASQTTAKMQDVLKQLLDKIRSKETEGKLNKDQFNKLFDLYAAELKIDAGILSQVKEELYNKYVSGDISKQNSNELAKMTSEIEETCKQSVKLDAQQEAILQELKDIKQALVQAMESGDESTIPEILSKLIGITAKLTEFSNSANALESKYGKSIDNMVNELNTAMADVNNTINEYQTKNGDKLDAANAMNEIQNEAKSKLDSVEVSFDQMMKLIDELFENRETVSVEDIINALKPYLGDDYNEINIDNVIKNIQQDRERRARTRGVDNEELSKINKLKDLLEKCKRNNGNITNIDDLTSAIKNEIDNQSYNSEPNQTLDDLINDFGIEDSEDFDINKARDEIKIAVNDCASELNIDLSSVKLSYNELVDALKAKFGNRTDITRTELKKAIIEIYTQKLMSAAAKKATNEINDNIDETKPQKSTSSDTMKALSEITNILSDNELTECISTQTLGYTSLLSAYSDILGTITEIVNAISQGKDIKLLISKLQGQINRLSQGIRNELQQNNDDNYLNSNMLNRKMSELNNISRQLGLTTDLPNIGTKLGFNNL